MCNQCAQLLNGLSESSLLAFSGEGSNPSFEPLHMFLGVMNEANGYRAIKLRHTNEGLAHCWSGVSDGAHSKLLT